MLMLGISTSSRSPSAAVMRDGAVLSFETDESGSSHSAALMALIESALKNAGVSKTELDAIAVDIGPGSFTGVRIGVSCANAMAFALGVGTVPVCSLAALRHAAKGEGTVVALLDARNGNGYAAAYNKEQELLAPCPCVINDILASYPKDSAEYVGDAAEVCTKALPDALLVLKEANSMLLSGEIKLAERMSDSTDTSAVRPSEAVPLYLRPSQAERMKG